MHNPLRYQITEYDCGPTSMLNAVSFLFPREEIPPEIIRNIMIYCLDCFGEDGTSGKCGTSHMAMMFLSHWINSYGQAGHLAVSSRYLSGREVSLSQNGYLRDTLRRGGAAVVRVDLEGWHYVLLTGIRDGEVRLFDPYFLKNPLPDPTMKIVTDHPTEYNRIIPASCFDREVRELYAFGPYEEREAVLLFNEHTKLTEEKTVEYII